MKALTVIATVLLLGLVAGCGGDGPPERTPTAAETDASLLRVGEQLDAGLPDRQFAPTSVGPTFLSCDDPYETGFNGSVTVSRAFTVEPAVDVTGARDVLTQIVGAAEAQGFVVTGDQRDLRAPSMSLRRPTDGTGMSVVTALQGAVTVTASRGCIWPDGTRPRA